MALLNLSWSTKLTNLVTKLVNLVQVGELGHEVDELVQCGLSSELPFKEISIKGHSEVGGVKAAGLPKSGVARLPKSGK